MSDVNGASKTKFAILTLTATVLSKIDAYQCRGAASASPTVTGDTSRSHARPARLPGTGVVSGSALARGRAETRRKAGSHLEGSGSERRQHVPRLRPCESGREARRVMKTLPDNPDLDHLRQQAKDLLPQLR